MAPIRTLLAGLFSALAVAQACAAPINVIAPASLTGSQVVTFNEVAEGNYNGILVSGGVGFAERFQGQTRASSGDHDVLSGTPSPALTLALGAPGQNVVVIFNETSNVMAGLGPLGHPNPNAVGEGAFAALFSTDQSEFGFDLVGGTDGSATVSFFRRDGSLIQALVLSGLSSQSYAFAREGGVLDIAGISVDNIDVGGIGFDNLRFDVPSQVGESLPEPASLALIGLALAGMGAARRRK